MEICDSDISYLLPTTKAFQLLQAPIPVFLVPVY